MHADDVVNRADRIEASISVDDMIAEFHDTDRIVTLDARSHEMLSVHSQIMGERVAAMHEVEGMRGTTMLQMRAGWPSLCTRRMVAEPIEPLSHAAHATMGYLVLCMLSTRAYVSRGRRSAQAGGDIIVATKDDWTGSDAQTLRESARAKVRATVAKKVEAPSPAQGVYDTIARSGSIAGSTANKYIETLRIIDRKTGVSRWPGGWLAALQTERFTELADEMRRTWSNPHTYLHKVSCILGALVHCREALGMDERQFVAARNFIDKEHRRAKAASYEKNLDNTLNKDREKRIISDDQIDVAIKKATLEMSRAQTRNDPRGVVYQQERLWLLILRHVPAKRSDWGRCVVLDHHPSDSHASGHDFNYICVSQSSSDEVVLVLRDYKTKKTYGEYREVMPATVANEIRASLRSYPRDYLFVDVSCGEKDSRDMKPFVKRSNYDRFARWVKSVSMKYFGVGATINDFRRRCVRDHADPSTHTRRERNETAKGMLHSLQSQELYRFIKPAKVSNAGPFVKRARKGK